MIPKIIAVGLIAAFLGAILAEMGCRTKKIFITLSVIIMMLALVSELGVIFGEILSVSEDAGATEVVKCALKIVGLGYVFGISAEVCEELGEKSISTLLVLFGRIEMLLVTLPYVKEMVEMGTRLIQ